MKQPPLIDELLDKSNMLGTDQAEINGRWYIAKPLPYYGWHNIVTRVYHAGLVLIGRASAWQYAEDRKGL